MRRALAVAGIAGLVLAAGVLGSTSTVESTATLTTESVALVAGDLDSQFVTPIVPTRGDVVGATWESGQPDTVEIRALKDDGWTEWQVLIADVEHTPDVGTSEAERTIDGTEATAFRDAEAVQFRVTGDRPEGFAASFVAVEGVGSMVPVASAAVPIQPRSAWDPGNNCTPRQTPEEIQIDIALVHHTGIDNYYAQSEVPGIILGYCLYHRNGRGWDDIAYNLLIDRFGTIWEGRAGGIDKGIRGGHTKGFNSYSTGIALIGNFVGQPPSTAQQKALTDLLAWKFEEHNIDIYSQSDLVSMGSYKWDEGVSVTMNALSGHRDAQATACPGNYCYNRFGSFRETVANEYRATPLDAYGPIASGDFGGNGSEDGVAFEPSTDEWIMFDGGSSSTVAWTSPDLGYDYTVATGADVGGDNKADVIAGAPGVVVDFVSSGAGFQAIEHAISGTPVAIDRAVVSGADQTVVLTSASVLVGPGFSSLGSVGNAKDLAVGDLDGDGTDEVVVLDGSAVRVFSPGGVSPLAGSGVSVGGVDRIVAGDFLGTGNASIAAIDMDAGVATLIRSSGTGIVTAGSVDFGTKQYLTEVFARTGVERAQLIALDAFVGEWKAATFDSSGGIATILEDQPWRTHVERDGAVADDSFLAWYGREFGWIRTEFGYGQDDDTNVTVEVSGASRYTTNVAVNRLAFNSADHVVLATSAKYPDALAAGAVAANYDSVVLLTDPGSLPSAIAAEIGRLGASTVTIAGGTEAISPAVEAQVAALGVAVQRVGGADRYETAASLSQAAFETADTVYIATGLNYPDALAGVPAAAARNAPILLVHNGSIPSSVVQELQRLAPTKVYILGGPVAVSNSVASQLASITGVTPTRLGGANRYDTAKIVSADAFSGTRDSVFVAPGTSYLDALVAGPVAAKLDTPVLLVPDDDVPGVVYNEVMRLRPDRIYLVGGSYGEHVVDGFDGIGPSTSTETLGFLPR